MFEYITTVASVLLTVCNAFYVPTGPHKPSVIVWNVQGPVTPNIANLVAAAAELSAIKSIPEVTLPAVTPVAQPTTAQISAIVGAAPAATPVATPAVAPAVSSAPVVAQSSAPEASVANISVVELFSSQPQPYNFGYRSVDNAGTTQTRSESRDGSNVVVGSYSYLDKLGMSRTVDYVADQTGFRAQIRTSEPGTETSEPADVKIQSSYRAV